MSMSSARAGASRRHSSTPNVSPRSLDKWGFIVMALSAKYSGTRVRGVCRERADRDALVDRCGGIAARVGDLGAKVPFAVGAERIARGRRRAGGIDLRVRRRARAETGEIARIGGIELVDLEH